MGHPPPSAAYIWKRTAGAGGGAPAYGPGTLFRFLCENFNDGSLRAGLDAQLTAVSATYTAVYVLIGLGKDRAPLSLKYGMEAPAMARFLFDAFLRGISADGAPPR